MGMRRVEAWTGGKHEVRTYIGMKLAPFKRIVREAGCSSVLKDQTRRATCVTQ